MSTPPTHFHPRHVFVSMLFSLVVGAWASIGVNAFPPLNWGQVLVWILALVVLVTSWTDWSASFNDPIPTGPRYEKMWYHLLVLDIFILLAYYVLANSVKATLTFNVQSLTTVTSTLFAIYALYFVWDSCMYVYVQKKPILEALVPSGVIALIVLIVLLLATTNMWSVLFGDDSSTEVNSFSAWALLAFLYAAVFAFRRFHAWRLEKWKAAIAK